jgi:hypothetical protein
MYSPIRVHGVVLNYLSTGTTLPYLLHLKKTVALVRKRTIPAERPAPVSEVSAKLCG